jgi:ATP/maltotriose-dependent transcriptional regulator MalT
VFEGDLGAAASAHREATAILDEIGSKLIAYAGVSQAALEATDDAVRRIDEQFENRSVGGTARLLTLWARATLWNAKGEYGEAFAAASGALEHPEDWNAPQCLHEHVEAAVRSGRPDAAADTLATLVEMSEMSETDWAVGIRQRCQALLARDADADDLYRDAIRHLGRTHLKPEIARSHLLYGEWLRRVNRRVDARAELQTAYDLFASVGATAFAERSRHELVLTGATVRKRSVEAYRDLTPQELEVCRLALDGLTNAEIGARLFISGRTVEWHLRKVFTKLGISNRRDLKQVLPSQVHS